MSYLTVFLIALVYELVGATLANSKPFSNFTYPQVMLLIWPFAVVVVAFLYVGSIVWEVMGAIVVSWGVFMGAIAKAIRRDSDDERKDRGHLR